MEDKVTLFGNIAHNLVDSAQEKYDHLETLMPDMKEYITECAMGNLDYFESGITREYESGLLSRLLVGLVEMGMAGYYCMNNKAITLNAIANQMTDLYARKNRDYGNSFDKSMDKFGMVVSVIRIGDKVNRLQALVKKKGEAEVKDESIADTLMDLACYAIMTQMWLVCEGNSEEKEAADE